MQRIESSKEIKRLNCFCYTSKEFCMEIIIVWLLHNFLRVNWSFQFLVFVLISFFSPDFECLSSITIFHVDYSYLACFKRLVNPYYLATTDPLLVYKLFNVSTFGF